MSTQSNSQQSFSPQQYANHPLFQRAQQMLAGKSLPEIKNVIKNVAANRGINEQQLSSILGQFGISF